MKETPWLLAPSGSLEIGNSSRLDQVEARHVTASLRRRTGDEVMLADGSGAVATAVIRDFGKGRVEAEVIEIRRHEAPVGDGLTLALSVIGRQAMDWAVQKAVELGVRRFCPVVSERTQVSKSDSSSRAEHWERIALQTLKQCHRPWAMEIADVTPLMLLVDRESELGGGVVADHDGSSVGDLPAMYGRILIVGPEGGFTNTECDVFDRRGWAKVCLGQNVLRAETAAIVGSAMLVAKVEGKGFRVRS